MSTITIAQMSDLHCGSPHFVPSLLERAIRDGVAAGTFKCADPTGAAWRILSVVDGLALQVVAHRTIVDRQHMLAWAATAAERELDLAPGVLKVGGSNGATPARAMPAEATPARAPRGLATPPRA